MADSSSKNEPAPESCDKKQLYDQIVKPGISCEEVTELYNKWAHQGYDEEINTDEYGALAQTKQVMLDLFPTGRDKAVVLDVGAGTGCFGQILRDHGFKLVDGLEPAVEMLRMAQEKKIYRRTYNCYISGDPTEIAADTYDAATLVGVMSYASLPLSAFDEVVRIVKPGGYIVNAIRKEHLHLVEEYRGKWEPLLERMEKSGKWKAVKICDYPNHYKNTVGLLAVFQVCV